MAHFAELDENNIVTRVIVVHNNEVQNLPFPESEPLGVEFCKSLYGKNTRWVQTSYNYNFRRMYAGIGCYYDSNLDIFVEIKPYPSWLYNASEGFWYPPVPKPQDGSVYYWDEDTRSWVPVLPNNRGQIP